MWVQETTEAMKGEKGGFLEVEKRGARTHVTCKVGYWGWNIQVGRVSRELGERSRIERESTKTNTYENIIRVLERWLRSQEYSQLL